MKQKAFAKINLYLNILGPRPDGYHEIETVMQSVSLFDVVEIRITGKGGIVLSCSKPYLPRDSRNIAHKAAVAFFEHTGISNPGIRIDIKKNIPVTAGLAGGSTNAAAALRILNAIFTAGLSEQELCELGTKLGADVPFCIMGGTYLCGGIGERLHKIEPMPDCHIVLCRPDIRVSTKEAYERYKTFELPESPGIAGLLDSLKTGDVKSAAGNMFNIFERLIPLDDVDIIKKRMIECGCMGTQMSGSGPTVFGIFEDKETAEQCAEQLKENYEETFICEPVTKNAEFGKRNSEL